MSKVPTKRKDANKAKSSGKEVYKEDGAAKERTKTGLNNSLRTFSYQCEESRGKRSTPVSAFWEIGKSEPQW